MERTSLTPAHRSRAIVLAASLAALVTAGACGDFSGPRSNIAAQPSFSATSVTSAAADVAAAAAITAGSHTLDLTNISLTIARAELKRTAADVCAGDEDEGDDDNAHGGDNDACGELKVGPTTVDLAVNGNAATIPALLRGCALG